MKENKYIRNVSISKEGTNNKQTMFPALFLKTSIDPASSPSRACLSGHPTGGFRQLTSDSSRLHSGVSRGRRKAAPLEGSDLARPRRVGELRTRAARARGPAAAPASTGQPQAAYTCLRYGRALQMCARRARAFVARARKCSRGSAGGQSPQTSRRPCLRRPAAIQLTSLPAVWTCATDVRRGPREPEARWVG